MKTYSSLKSIICAFIITLQCGLLMPLTDVILRNILVTNSSMENKTDVYIYSSYIISSLSFVLIFFLCFFGVRVLNVSMPTSKVPWCAPISQITNKDNQFVDSSHSSSIINHWLQRNFDYCWSNYNIHSLTLSRNLSCLLCTQLWKVCWHYNESKRLHGMPCPRNWDDIKGPIG